MTGVLAVLAAAGFTPTLESHTGPGSGTAVCPVGANRCTITSVGKGGDGALRTSNGQGFSGGGGAECVSTLAVAAGDQIDWTIDDTGTSTANGTGGLSGLAHSAGAGGDASDMANGAGGTASGGETNTNGAAGANAKGGDAGSGALGGASASALFDPETGEWYQPIAATSGAAPGGGGGGGFHGSLGAGIDLPGASGGAGRISFLWHVA